MFDNEKTFTTLEFDKIRHMLADCTSVPGAREMALSLTPETDRDFVLQRQKRTTDAKALLENKGTPPFGSVYDMGAVCDRADKGAVLTTRELIDVGALLRAARLLLDYIRSNHLFDTSLDEIFERLIPERKLEDKIGRTILSEDMIADEASPLLSDIRRKIRITNNKIKEVLQRYTGGNATSKYLQENIVTMRNGRYVVPVKAEYKNEVRGLVHDSSASGATLFIEPMAVVDANNELRELSAREEHEIERILAELSAGVAQISQILRLNYENITELAFYFACAALSVKMDGMSPQISGDRSLSLRRARHPLISRDRVVPIDVAMGDGYDTIIITGPNTGGKTVTLKTLGLFALMVQAGLHIPVEEPSSVCLFDKILADIGDEQSIEQSLSTFSSHMVNIVSIMDEVGDSSLVLFDELGVGTDPVEGAALAVAVIEAVRAKGAMCAATTHYSELKSYALDTEGVCNASCEFDVETLKPTYKLIIGTPGKSNAFAISTKLGLSPAIVERAGELVSADNKRFEDTIEKLEQSRMEMERNREAALEFRREYERFKEESERRIQERLKEADQTLESARAKATAMVESARVSSDFVLSQLDEVRKKRDSERLGDELTRARQEIRAHLRENEDKFNPVVERSNENYVLPRKLKKGDEVYIVNIGKRGFLTEDPDRNGSVTVQAGILKTRTKIENLRLVENETVFVDKENKKKTAASVVRASVSRSVRDEIDLRGKTGDEAWLSVDKYLDEVILAGLHSVRLIHGKGTGALKQALWQYLKTDKRIASFRIGRYGEGDGGVTIVDLK